MMVLISIFIRTRKQDIFRLLRRVNAPGGGGHCHIWAISVCAAVKGMVFKQFTLG